jgi:hypothetical protein
LPIDKPSTQNVEAFGQLPGASYTNATEHQAGGGSHLLGDVFEKEAFEELFERVKRRRKE